MYKKIRWQSAFKIITLIVLAIIGFFIFKGKTESYNSPITQEEYCKTLGYRNYQNIPVKCIKYFLNPDERVIYQSVVREY